MARERSMVVGRQPELAVLDAACHGAESTGDLLLIRGQAGIGKSTLLEETGRRWREAGGGTLTVRFSDTAAPWDAFGAQALVGAVSEHFEQFGDLRLADSIHAVTRLCVPRTYRSKHGRSVLLVELDRMFDRIRRDQPIVLLADDLHLVAKPMLALASAGQAGCRVIAACRDDGVAGSAQLLPLADRLLDLGPLPEDCLESLVARSGPAPLDESLLPALRTALGPLYGNPGALLATLDELRRGGRLVVVRDQLCLRDPHAPIGLPADHELVQQVRRYGPVGCELVTLVAGSHQFGVDDLPVFAAATGRALTECGAVLDRLVLAGLLSCGPWGRLESRCPALITALLGEVEVGRLHQALAGVLLGVAAGGRPDPAVLADHVALAGADLPADPGLAGLLIAEADRIEPVEPDRAARWYHAALRHAGAAHPDRDRVRTRLLRLLVRIGRYEWLREVVAEAVLTDGAGGKDDDRRAELAAAAALAALHTGRPVPSAVQLGLGGVASPEDSGPLAFCARWWSEAGAATEGGDLAAAFAAFGPPAEQVRPVAHVRAAVHRDELLEAGSMRDLVAGFELVLGTGYGVPRTGPLAAHHRVVRGYFGGDWSDALSAARALELTAGPAHTPAHQFARLLAAEICAYRGDQRRAVAWLDSVPEQGRLIALRAWVESALRRQDSDPDTVISVGWCGYQRALAAGATDGLAPLLGRLLCFAVESDLPDRAMVLFGELQTLHARENTRITRQALLLGDALVLEDTASALAGVELARRRGHQPDLALACLVAARLTEECRPWFQEAHGIATRIGSPLLRAGCAQKMRERGLTAPRNQSSRDRFSPTELAIIAHIRDGRTNRQIALAIRVSEKTVENYLTRLFAKTGCRSRLDLAAASLEGRLMAVGA